MEINIINEPNEQVTEPNEQVTGPNEQVIEPNEQVIEPNEQVTGPNEQVIEPNEQQKRKRGRPKKSQQAKNDKDMFLNDLVEHRFVDNVSGNADITYPFDDDEPKIELPPIKDTLLFLDGIICYSLKRFLKKNIEPMSEEDAEFIARLAPSDLQLLKPSKETFFYTLAAYYLLKIF
jgi:hypothetical protein